MKFISFLVITCSVYLSIQSDTKVQDEAAEFFKGSSANWTADSINAQREAKIVFSRMTAQIEYLRKNILNIATSTKKQAFIDKVNKTLIDNLPKMDDFSDDKIAKFFSDIDGTVVAFLNQISAYMGQLKSSNKLTNCWKQNKPQLEGLVVKFLKDLRAMISAETKSVYNIVNYDRPEIVAAGTNLTAEIAKCSENSIKCQQSTVSIYKSFGLVENWTFPSFQLESFWGNYGEKVKTMKNNLLNGIAVMSSNINTKGKTIYDGAGTKLSDVRKAFESCMK